MKFAILNGQTMKLSKVAISLPFGLGSAEFEPSQEDRDTAWDLYVELMTRVASQEIGRTDGLLRETLNSLYSLFDITREILRSRGPSIGQDPYSVGAIAIQVLNKGIRPFLAKWHPLLLAHEEKRAPGVSIIEHEAAWPLTKQFRDELTSLQSEIKKYAIE
jgi:hypothetical protein